MTVHVQLFASIREQIGSPAIDVELADGATVGELRARLGRLYPPLVRSFTACRFAVNQDFASDDVQLQPTDEVAIIPPVSGG